MIMYDEIFIFWGSLIHEPEKKTRQVILFVDELALQPRNQVNLLGQHTHVLDLYTICMESHSLQYPFWKYSFFFTFYLCLCQM